jgi:hypothetical protein
MWHKLLAYFGLDGNLRERHPKFYALLVVAVVALCVSGALSLTRDYGVGGFVLVTVTSLAVGLAIALAIRHSRATD